MCIETLIYKWVSQMPLFCLKKKSGFFYFFLSLRYPGSSLESTAFVICPSSTQEPKKNSLYVEKSITGAFPPLYPPS
jgi:hypothetical protein